ALGKDVVVFAVPIYQTGGRLVGALTAKLDLAAVHHLLRRFAAGTSGRVYLITPGGQRLVGSGVERAHLQQRQIEPDYTAGLAAPSRVVDTPSRSTCRSWAVAHAST